jgi:uncharacterized cupin superfamily protein
MATKANLVIDQGTTFSTIITVADVEGVALDLSNYTGAAQMRKHYSSSNSFSFTIYVANTGTVTLSMSANTTANITSGRYVYDCEITSNTGVVSRIAEGIVTVTPEVTR